MWNNILIGCLLIVLTSFIHTLITRIVLSIVQKKPAKQTPFRRIIHIDLIILIIMLATLIESAIWALTYLQIGSFDMFEEALYFSLVTYSTLGYGDVILSDSHRLLGAFEAANGVIMLGWSTAIVVSALQKIYVKSTR
jgi:hypothetical protein